MSRAGGSRRRAYRKLLDGGIGTIAQGFTLLASLLPVFWGRIDVLVGVVSLSAVAAMTLPFVSMAAGQLLPVEKSVRSALHRIGATAIWLGIWGILAIGGFTIAGSILFANWGAGLCLGLLITANGAFIVLLASLVWRGDYRAVMTARLIYGISVATLTLFVCVIDAPAAGYLAAMATAYVVAIACVASRHRRIWWLALQSARRAGMRRGFVVIRASIPLMGAQTTSAAASQIGALATPLLGELAQSWAVLVRIMGGFQTLGAQVVGVSLDIRLASRVRARDLTGVVRAVIRSISIAIVLGIVGGIISAMAAALLAPLPEEGGLYLLGALTYAAGQIALAPIGHALGFVGNHVMRLAWEIVRLLATIGVLVILAGSDLVTGMAIVSFASFASYALLVFISARAVAKRSQLPVHAGGLAT